MALTGPQEAACRKAIGRSFGFNDRDSDFEQAISGLASKPDEELLVTDTLVNGGILATIADIEAKIVLAHKRLKASAVGSIKLNEGEIERLRREGTRHVYILARILGLAVIDGGQFSLTQPMGGFDNYVGR